MDIKEEKDKKNSVLLYNCFQICNLLRLTLYDRGVVRLKYEDIQLSESDWKKLLKKDGINF